MSFQRPAVFLPGVKFAIALGTVVLLLASIASADGVPAPKPNVIIFLADDMGFSDAGCYGSEIQTPNLDHLAAQGLRFTQFHNTARCWPSRGALMTGYYAQAIRRDTVPGIRSGVNGVRPKWAQLIPQLLKPLGYRCYHSGKWHIDGSQLKGGFDHSYTLNDHDRYFYPQLHTEDDVPLPAVDPKAGYYSTTAIADYAIKYLKEHAEQHAHEPFFEFVAFTSPHFPLQAPADDIARYANRYASGWDAIRVERWQRQREFGILSCELSVRDEKTIPQYNLPETVLHNRVGPYEVGYAVPWADLTAEQKSFQAAKMSVHAAMVDRMDQEIGRVLKQLDEMKASENTLVLFLSDNGASAEQIIRGDGNDVAAPPGSPQTFLGLGPGWSTAANTPLRLHKSWVHEGGTSTPLIVRWPRGIAAHGELRSTPSHLIDIAPTVLELAGGRWPIAVGDLPVPPPPGVSLVPVFTKDGTIQHDYFWWFHDNNKAVRVGDWKLVSAGKDSPWELYNLSTDRSEMKNLADDYPERVKTLAKVWQTHMDEFRALAAKDVPPEVPAKDPYDGDD